MTAPRRLAPYAGAEPVAPGGTVGRTNGRLLGFYAKPGSRPAVMIRFDQDAFDAIALEAQRRGVSFAEVVRRLIDKGLAVSNNADPAGK